MDLLGGRSWCWTSGLEVVPLSHPANACVLQMQELEQKVMEADQRAVNAEEQVLGFFSACCWFGMAESHLPDPVWEVPS